MKITQLLTLLFMLMYFSISAQDFNIAYQPSFYSFSNRLLPVSENRFLIGGQVGVFMGYPVFAPFLKMVDENGVGVWEDRILEVEGTELGEITDMEINDNGQIFIAGVVSGCDYGLPGFMAEYDSLGNKIWLEEIWGLLHISLLPDGNLALLSQLGELSRFDPAEGVVWEVDLRESGQIFHSREVVYGPDQHIYVLSADKLFKINLEGEVVSELEITQGQTIVAASGSNHLWLLTSNKLQKLDTQLSTVDEIELSGEGQFDKLKVEGALMYAMGKTNNAQPVVVKLTDDLQIDTSFTILDEYFIPYDFQIVNDRLIFTGDELVDPYTSSQEINYYNRTLVHRGSNIFLYTTDLAGNAPELMDDAAVTEVSYQNITLDSIGDCGSAAGTVTWDGINISIKNEGSTILETVSLNISFVPCSFICASKITATRNYDNLNLAPGESITINWGGLQVQGLVFQELSELCFWTSIPNGRIDGDHSNNNFCADIIIDTREVVANSHDLTLFPNPASDVLEVQYSGQSQLFQQYRVVNIMGQVVLSGQWPQGQNRISLNVNDLDSGMYIFQLSGDLQVLVQQIVVE